MIAILLGNFYNDFAAEAAKIVLEKGELDHLYQLATGSTPNRTKAEKEKIVFRAAYILEYIYFHDNSHFKPYRSHFLEDYPKTTNESAKRHFTKIMRDLLQQEKPNRDSCHAIAEASASWILEPKTRVAVKIGAIEVLLLLKDEVEWIEEVLPEIIGTISREASPAIEVRLRKWNKG